MQTLKVSTRSTKQNIDGFAHNNPRLLPRRRSRSEADMSGLGIANEEIHLQKCHNQSLISGSKSTTDSLPIDPGLPDENLPESAADVTLNQSPAFSNPPSVLKAEPTVVAHHESVPVKAYIM